ncbi:unknown [Blautia sp. CAG:37]|nr:unknown [Blautia sp. CAG:37]
MHQPLHVGKKREKRDKHLFFFGRSIKKPLAQCESIRGRVKEQRTNQIEMRGTPGKADRLNIEKDIAVSQIHLKIGRESSGGRIYDLHKVFCLL